MQLQVLKDAQRALTGEVHGATSLPRSVASQPAPPADAAQGGDFPGGDFPLPPESPDAGGLPVFGTVRSVSTTGRNAGTAPPSAPLTRIPLGSAPPQRCSPLPGDPEEAEDWFIIYVSIISRKIIPQTRIITSENAVSTSRPKQNL